VDTAGNGADGDPSRPLSWPGGGRPDHHHLVDDVNHQRDLDHRPLDDLDDGTEPLHRPAVHGATAAGLPGRGERRGRPHQRWILLEQPDPGRPGPHHRRLCLRPPRGSAGHARGQAGGDAHPALRSARCAHPDHAPREGRSHTARRRQSRALRRRLPGRLPHPRRLHPLAAGRRRLPRPPRCPGRHHPEDGPKHRSDRL
ncbi:MAG: hypothetical protein AVDCRST_MAG10-615, partial [uncultured Acidimicrobiales bacterium]